MGLPSPKSCAFPMLCLGPPPAESTSSCQEHFPEPLGTGLDFHKHWEKESNPREIGSETQLLGGAS